MCKKQVILILCVLWIGGSLAKSFRPTSFDYDYREDSRKSSNNYRGRSASTTPRPSFQQYWESFVRNLPTLPPLRWNMTNSLGNLFNAGAQQVMETPVGVYEMIEEDEPNRRKNSNRKSTTKKNKNRKSGQTRIQSNYYNYQTHAHNDGYQQIQLQPLGVDEKNVMHFYEPITGQYYAMQMVSGPPSIYNHDYYNNQEQNAYKNSNNEDDAYYNDASYGNEGYAEEEQEPNNENDRKNTDYENEYNNNEDEQESAGNEDYADDVVLSDNWGYTDDEVFSDRNLKASLKPAEIKNIVKIQKHLLKPETEEDVMILLPQEQEDIVKRIKPSIKKEIITEEKEIESIRNVIGTFMKDDRVNRRRQSTNTKQSTRQVEKPRQRERYYIFPADFWLK